MAISQSQTTFSVNAIRIAPKQEIHIGTNHHAKPEPQFNYDLERMRQMVESETVYMPSHLKTADEIMRWLEGKL